MKTRIVPTLITLFTLGSVAGLARAEDAVYAGVGCLAKDDSVTAFQREGSGIENVDNISHDVFCPIARDNQQPGILSVTVFVVDQNAKQDVECQLVVHERDGSNFSTPVVAKSTGSDPKAQSLSFGPATAPANGYYTLLCSVAGAPAAAGSGRSAIVSYRVRE